MRDARCRWAWLALFALTGCVRAELLDGGPGDADAMDSGVDAAMVIHDCDSHDDCLGSPAPDALVCADRGEGRRCFPSCNEGECAGHPFGVVCVAPGVTPCGCTRPSECPSPFATFCAPSGFCGECESDAQCSGATPVCLVEFGYCVECAMDSHCASNDCDTDMGECR